MFGPSGSSITIQVQPPATIDDDVPREHQYRPMRYVIEKPDTRGPLAEAESRQSAIRNLLDTIVCMIKVACERSTRF